MLSLTWSQWTLVGCVIASFILTLAGAVRGLVALSSIRPHLAAAQSRVAAIKASVVSARVDRISDDIANMPALIQRAQHAVDSMNRSLQALKLPDAVAALRSAAAAVKLLVSGR